MKIILGNFILKNMNESKPILSIETSQNLCSVCVYYADEKFYEMSFSFKNSHAEKLFGIIDAVLNLASIRPNDLDAIGVSAGPGSFTGLRIGMAAAKGIAYGAKIAVIPVPTFEALAYQLSFYLPNESEVIIVNKVNSDELYLAKFQIKSNSYIFANNLELITRNEFSKRNYTGLLFGNSGFIEPVNFCKNISSPNSLYVAKWCKAFGDSLRTFDYDFLEPNYLKNFIVKERKNGHKNY